MSGASKRKAKRKWAIEKPKLDNARKLRGIYFIEPEDEDFKNIMKNSRRKLEIPMPTALPCKTPITAVVKPTAVLGKARQKMLVLSMPTKRLEGVPDRYHECHIAAKGMNSLSHYNLVHKFVPMPQA